MNRIFHLCLPLAAGAMLLSQISTANGAVDPRVAAAARANAGRAAAPRVASVPRAMPHAAMPRAAAMPRVAARPAIQQRSFAARPTINRPVARRSVPVQHPVAQSRTVNRAVLATAQSRAARPTTVNRSAIARSRVNSNAVVNRNAITQNRLTNNRGFNRGNRNLALRQTPNANRINNTVVNNRNPAAASAITANQARVNTRRNIASNQFAFRSGNFHRGWNTGRTYAWNHHHWRNFNGVWAVTDAGWPSDWYGYPYPFAYDNTVYYGGDVYDPGTVSEPPAVAENTVVSDVQNSLATMGYNPGPVDGVPGPQTEQAIAQYQQDNGMAATGQIDSTLLDSLGI